MKKILAQVTAIIILLLLNTGCSVHHQLKCPGFTAKRAAPKAHGHVAYHHQRHEKKERAETPRPVKEGNQQTTDAGGLALGGGGGKNIEMKIPKMFSSKFKEGEAEKANELLKAESNNNVSLVKKANGKFYLKAKSRSDFTRLATSLLKHSREKAPPTPGATAAPDGSGVALASGIIGIIAFVLAFGPYVGFAAFVLAVVAIILGILGLGSRLRAWAVVGIVLGVITLLIAVLFALVVFAGMVF